MQRAVSAELIAVLVSVTAGRPAVLTVQAGERLPSGPFAVGHRSLQAGLRGWVEAQTRHELGYLEQLYTFGDQGRAEAAISISYLGLTRRAAGEASWRDWYEYFPWEDRRGDDAPPADGAGPFAAGLRRWAEAEPALRAARHERAAITFGQDGESWNEELVLQRYELLYEAGLVPEAVRDRGGAAAPPLGRAMASDHRRIVATGIARLRAKIKYRPVVFELMPPAFTLLQLQRCVEGVAGRPVHKQNFRRLVEQQALVEETGETTPDTGGRPAKLFRFRRAVQAERAVSGTKPPLARA